MDFQNSITQQTMASVEKDWAKKLSENELWLQTKTKEEIFKFLNDRENLCTAEFILRRQIQTHFPLLMQKAAMAAGLTQADYADLSTSGNIAWPVKLVDELGTKLASKEFTDVSELNLDQRQWKKILLGEAFCNRTNAIKLIFALHMEGATVEEFLIANGKNTFSTRNPFDYICEFCLKGGFSYDTALEILKAFETERKDFFGDNSQEPMEFGTIHLKNETQRILSDDKLTPVKKQEQIVKYMLDHQKEFVAKVERKNRRAEYPSGFSKQNNLKLKIFLRYLTKLYPQFLIDKKEHDFNTEDEKSEEKKAKGAPKKPAPTLFQVVDSQSVEKNSDGTPKKPDQLWRAIKDELEIDFLKTEQLEAMGLPTGKETDEKGHRLLREKQRYDAIPFNSAIILPLRNLSVTLRSNLRAEEKPDNAQDVDRSTVLFLTYFFICGCQSLNDGLGELSEEFEKAISEEENPENNKLYYALKAVVNNVENMAYEENPMQLYIDSLNELLECFNCSKFYAPFVVDKFILFCLLTLRCPKNEEDFPQHLMNVIIEESYRLSKKILEGKGNDS